MPEADSVRHIAGSDAEASASLRATASAAPGAGPSDVPAPSRPGGFAAAPSAAFAASPLAASVESVSPSLSRAQPPAVLTRTTLTAPDGLALSVLVATPGAGIRPASAMPPIVALHGFASSAASGWGRTGHLDTLTRAGRTVIGIDLRGHGESGKPHDSAAYTLAAVLADIAAVVAEIPSLTARLAPGVAPSRPGPVDLIGYSLGSRLAWTAVCRSIVPVRRLVLGGFDGRPLFEGVDTGRLDRLAAGVAGNDRTALAALVAGLAGTGGTPEGDPVPAIPALIVAGDRDPLAVRAEQFAAGLPRGEFLSIPGRNHISTVPARDYRNRIAEFLSTPHDR